MVDIQTNSKVIETVTVIGANGVMGSGIVRLLAKTRKVKIYLVSRSKKHSVDTIKRILDESSSPRTLGLMIACDYSVLNDCIIESDWVFESVAEDLSIKLNVHRRINLVMGHETIVSSGTSSFRIEDLASAYSKKNRKQFFGTHFFNPPDMLPLLELVITTWNNKRSGDILHTFFTSVLNRSCVVVKDVSGFLANRIGALFLNEALLLIEQSKGRWGIESIDSVLGRFTGRALPPIMTIDYIGLDVFTTMIKNILDDIGEGVSPKMIPFSIGLLIASGRTGRKAGAGYYKTIINQLNEKERFVLDVLSSTYKSANEYNHQFAKTMIALQQKGQYMQSFEVLAKCNTKEAHLCKYLLLRYVAISYAVTKEITHNPADVDVAMEFGYRWVSPRKLVWLLGGSAGIASMVGTDKQLQSALSGIDIGMLDSFKTPLVKKDLALFPVHEKK